MRPHIYSLIRKLFIYSLIRRKENFHLISRLWFSWLVLYFFHKNFYWKIFTLKIWWYRIFGTSVATWRGGVIQDGVIGWAEERLGEMALCDWMKNDDAAMTHKELWKYCRTDYVTCLPNWNWKSWTVIKNSGWIGKRDETQIDSYGFNSPTAPKFSNFRWSFSTLDFTT